MTLKLTLINFLKYKLFYFFTSENDKVRVLGDGGMRQSALQQISHLCVRLVRSDNYVDMRNVSKSLNNTVKLKAKQTRNTILNPLKIWSLIENFFGLLCIYTQKHLISKHKLFKNNKYLDSFLDNIGGDRNSLLKSSMRLIFQSFLQQLLSQFLILFTTCLPRVVDILQIIKINAS